MEMLNQQAEWYALLTPWTGRVMVNARTVGTVQQKTGDGCDGGPRTSREECRNQG